MQCTHWSTWWRSGDLNISMIHWLSERVAEHYAVASLLWFHSGVNICAFWTVDWPHFPWNRREMVHLWEKTGLSSTFNPNAAVKHWDQFSRFFALPISQIYYNFANNCKKCNSTCDLCFSAISLVQSETVWMNIWWRYKWAFMNQMYE